MTMDPYCSSTKTNRDGSSLVVGQMIRFQSVHESHKRFDVSTGDVGTVNTRRVEYSLATWIGQEVMVLEQSGHR